MPQTALDGVELSELPEQARASIQSILDENSRLSRESREGRVNARIAELEGMGLKERPGALKLYREIMLSDDGGPAVVLLSDSGEERERLTALEILDRFLAGLAVDGGVQLSDQHFVSPNDNKPPVDASDEKAPLEERVASAKESLYGKRNRRK